MTQKQFLKALEEGYKKNVEISRRKNTDYAGNGDAFKNFRASEAFGVSVPMAIMVRMSDKMARVGNLLKQKGEVKDERIEDTLSDLANYAMILKVFLENEK